MKIHVGTSGWSYNHWKARFYPPEVPKRAWLSYLASIFDTVELNATFYKQPKPETFRKWHDTTPGHFLFSIKASRFITHVKKLKDIKEPLARFYEGVAPLREKVSAILFQLPPSLKFEPDVMKAFLGQIDPQYRTVIEPRNLTFFTETFYRLLTSANCCLCWSDTGGRYPYEEVVTTDFIYLRLHGSPVLYRSSYSEDTLSSLGEKILKSGLDAFVYFDNDAEGHAPANALWLKNYLEKRKNA